MRARAYVLAFGLALSGGGSAQQPREQPPLLAGRVVEGRLDGVEMRHSLSLRAG